MGVLAIVLFCVWVVDDVGYFLVILTHVSVESISLRYEGLDIADPADIISTAVYVAGFETVFLFGFKFTE